MKCQTYPAFLVRAYMYAWAHIFLFNILIQQVSTVWYRLSSLEITELELLYTCRTILKVHVLV